MKKEITFTAKQVGERVKERRTELNLTMPELGKGNDDIMGELMPKDIVERVGIREHGTSIWLSIEYRIQT